MPKFAAIALVALAVAACRPVPPTDPLPDQSRPEVPTTSEGCKAAGGSWGPQGLLGREQCVLAMPDAGKTCRDGDDCVGDCRVNADGPAPDLGASVTGRCQATTSPFGCYGRVEDGKSQGMLCVD